MVSVAWFPPHPHPHPPLHLCTVGGSGNQSPIPGSLLGAGPLNAFPPFPPSPAVLCVSDCHVLFSIRVNILATKYEKNEITAPHLHDACGLFCGAEWGFSFSPSAALLSLRSVFSPTIGWLNHKGQWGERPLRCKALTAGKVEQRMLIFALKMWKYTLVSVWDEQRINLWAKTLVRNTAHLLNHTISN